MEGLGPSVDAAETERHFLWVRVDQHGFVVGEPPLVLAATVYFAVKHAVLAARKDRGRDEWFTLESPATVERIREACRVETADLIAREDRGEAGVARLKVKEDDRDCKLKSERSVGVHVVRERLS